LTTALSSPPDQFQPLASTAGFENLIYVAEGAEDTGASPDINEAARVEWVPLSKIRHMIANCEIIGAGAQLGLMLVLAG